MKIKSKSYVYFKSFIWCIDEKYQHLLKICSKNWEVLEVIHLNGFGNAFNTQLISNDRFLYCINLNNGIIIRIDVESHETYICSSGNDCVFAAAFLYKDRLLMIPKESSDNIVWLLLESNKTESITFLKPEIINHINYSKICNVLMIDSEKLIITFVSAYFYALFELNTGYVEIRHSHNQLYKCVVSQKNGNIIFSYRKRMGYYLIKKDGREQEIIFDPKNEGNNFIVRLIQAGNIVIAMTENRVYVIDDKGELIDLNVFLKCSAKEQSLFMNVFLTNDSYYLLPYGAEHFLKVNNKTLDTSQFDVTINENAKGFLDEEMCYFQEGKFDIADLISLISTKC